MDDVKNRKVLILKYEKKLLDKIMALKSDWFVCIYGFMLIKLGMKAHNKRRMYYPFKA